MVGKESFEEQFTMQVAWSVLGDFFFVEFGAISFMLSEFVFLVFFWERVHDTITRDFCDDGSHGDFLDGIITIDNRSDFS